MCIADIGSREEYTVTGVGQGLVMAVRLPRDEGESSRILGRPRPPSWSRLRRFSRPPARPSARPMAHVRSTGAARRVGFRFLALLVIGRNHEAAAMLTQRASRRRCRLPPQSRRRRRSWPALQYFRYLDFPSAVVSLRFESRQYYSRCQKPSFTPLCLLLLTRPGSGSGLRGRLPPLGGHESRWGAR
ncbi:hypothetical protein CTRI78_v005310 [Colletotrichum trifolii]|uniref:Uncharacterized protein n=1 Tax=Colletotrichum trifolii TaxID=5466 RepID=A0A4R8RF59_COLTR|nr:hypothetical protein CTRI78_v005310 [Colletotrichum trifolii]